MNSERVLLVVDALYIGGTETHVLGLAKELVKNDTFVAIAANKTGNLVNSFEALNCPIYHIEFPKSITLKEDHEMELIGEIEKIIDSENISHIHIHQAPSGYLAGKAAENRGIPTILTIHGTYYPDYEMEELLKLSDAVICVSPPLCNYIKTFGIEKPHLIPNGINLENYPKNSPTENVRSILKIPEDSIVLLYASRIAWSKAHVCSVFLRACKDLKLQSFPDLHVIIVGDGNKLADIKSLAQMIEEICEDSFIHIVGEQKNMHAYYSAADCIVGTGRVALEAMASEKQVVAVGNHGYFGIVDTKNIEDAWSHYFGDHGSKGTCSRHKLRDDLKKIIEDKEQLRLNGIKFREIVEERFNIQTIVKETLKIYFETVKGGMIK
ncbi:glycosyltransferase [Solibacillus silvestris]|uniref:glycosyltransferase n=1 Tax=Solibacillus silvestris TaxID=76853 RepID=UPI003F811F92